jgi:hypothetical protein
MAKYDLKAKIAEAAKTGPNMTEATGGGGDYTPPEKGMAWARFVGYFETGKHEEEYEGKKSDRNKVDLVFELSGPNHEPRRLDDGTLIPQRVTAQETLSTSDKANFFKMFAAMNYAGKATHMAELLGEAFYVEIFHKKSKDGKKTYATMKGAKNTLPVGNGYVIKGPSVQDPMTGKAQLIPVPAPITELKAFIWDIADKDMWDSIFIEGEYPEQKDDKGEVTKAARSKNAIQQKIMRAKNWAAHPLASIVAAGGVTPDLPEAEEPGREPGEDDDLPGVGETAGADPLANIG